MTDVDYARALLAPWLERIDREQIGTHSPDCHTYHRDCLILALERALPIIIRESRADAWSEGAAWAAVELGAINTEEVPWEAPGENPYREEA